MISYYQIQLIKLYASKNVCDYRFNYFTNFFRKLGIRNNKIGLYHFFENGFHRICCLRKKSIYTKFQVDKSRSSDNPTGR